MLAALVLAALAQADGGVDGGLAGAATVDVNACARKVEVCFSPGQCDTLLQHYVDRASRIELAMYSLTRASLVDALRRAHARSVVDGGVGKVRVVVDDTQAVGVSMSVALRILQTAGVQVRQDDSGGAMHLKVAIFDGATVAFGSFNWTLNAASRNDEVVVIWRCPALAGSMLAEFEKVWGAGRGVSAADGGV